jgi:glycerophosphoryl diester phosphodiesterase
MSAEAAFRMKRPWDTAIAAHRGGAKEWPENSPTAFRNTAAQAVEFVEFDVHRSRDGVLVVHHDATLERTTSGAGPIGALDWAELQALTLRGAGGERIPSLAEVIGIFRPTPIALRLEIKCDANDDPYPGMEAEIARTLESEAMLARTVVTSFFLDTLGAFRAAATPAGAIWLIEPLVLKSIGGLVPAIDLAVARGVTEIGLHHEMLGPHELVLCLDRGFRLGAWAAHDESPIRRMLRAGVTAFTTDRPTLALRLRDEMRQNGEI